LLRKKVCSFDKNKNKISKQMDPRLSSDLRGTKLFVQNKSFLFLTKEYFAKKEILIFYRTKKPYSTRTNQK
jgi:hypothetical protein